jgi:hypothetical protein
MRLLTYFNKPLFRTGRLLQGQADSLQKGPVHRSIKDEFALVLIQVQPDTSIGNTNDIGC